MRTISATSGARALDTSTRRAGGSLEARPVRRPAATRAVAGLAAAVIVGLAFLAAGSAASPDQATASEDGGCVEEASDAAGIDRVAGADRFATAACAARVVFADPDEVAHVVLARGDAAGDLADALSGAVLAHAVDGPVLLTRPDALPEATAEELARLDPERATVLGGSAAVGDEVVDALDAYADVIDRVAGGSRAETATAVAERVDPSGTAFVVNGFRPADALVAAAPAAREGGALLQVTEAGVPEATREALADIDEVVVVGGHGVVPSEVADELGDLVGSVRRVSGADRGETSAAVARAFPADGRVHVASGQDGQLVDAVTAGWAAARPGGGPVVYSGRETLFDQVTRWLLLDGLAGDAQRELRLLGGQAVLGDDVVAELEAHAAQAADGGPDAELRGWWVDAFDSTLRSRAGIHRMLSDATRSGANTVVVQVARRQDALHDSAVLPRLPEPDLPDDLDVLAEVSDAARDRGLAVHAWVTVLPAYHEVYDDLALPDAHVWRRHGPDSDAPWTSRDVDGDPVPYLDPGVGEVHDHAAAVLAELAGDYDVDAVHLDYVRYQHGDVTLADDEDHGTTGYHPTSLARFVDQVDGDADPDPADPDWAAWRRAQTRDLAHRIRAEVADADPTVAVSQAGITWGEAPDEAGGFEATTPYRWVFQDWPGWLADGAIDVAMPMNYFPESTQANDFDGWTRWQADLDHDGLLAIGQGALVNEPADSLEQLARARDRADGAVVYNYQRQTAADEPEGLAGPLSEELWAAPTPAPELPAATDHGIVVASAPDGEAVTLTDAEGDAHVERADAADQAVFLGLPAGEATVTASGVSATVAVAEGAVERVELDAAPGQGASGS